MNPWNEVILKPELVPNANLGGGMQSNLMYANNENENTNNGLIMMGSGGPNGVSNVGSHQTAAVAAAVATAMMMSHQNGPNNMMLNNNQRLPSNINPNMIASQQMILSSNDDQNDDDDTMDNDDDDDCGSVNNDAEGVWSPDIEQSFQEALAIYPPCGRRKIILSEEGKMYGRNELIARYIKVRTGKTRSRKQVSSHIQVLAKRKTKDFHNHLKDGKDGKTINGFPNPFSNLTSAQIISPSTIPLQTQQPNLINQNSMPSQISNNQSLQQQQLQQMRNNLPQPHHQPHHQSQLLQNCTNLLSNNINGPQSTSIWSHPGLQKLMPGSSSVPSSTSSNQLNDDLTPSSSASSSSSTSSQNQENRHAHHGHHHHHHTHHNNHLSPDSSPRSNNQLWSMYNNNTSSLYKKCVIGLHQLRLIEFSGFLEKRRDPEIYHKHLFVHLNTSDFSPLGNGLPSANTSPSSGNGPVSFTGNSATPSSTSSSSSSSGSTNGNTNTNGTSNQNSDSLLNGGGGEFECINYKEFADKFPENDLIMSTNTDKPVAYLIKFWVDLNYVLEDNVSSLYAVTNIFESPESMNISCSTKVCSFGNQVVEKVETERASYESNGRYVYKFENSPMCEYMITFINKLKQLPEKSLKNSVLENFSVLQSIKNHDTKEVLLTLAYVFEVSTSEHGAQHVIYRLVNK